MVFTRGPRRGFLVLAHDEGPGIERSVADHIFDPLFRGRDSAGAGLGLAIVKSAVTVLGGTIDMVSPVVSGRGTSFIISLPDTL